MPFDDSPSDTDPDSEEPEPPFHPTPPDGSLDRRALPLAHVLSASEQTVQGTARLRLLTFLTEYRLMTDTDVDHETYDWRATEVGPRSERFAEDLRRMSTVRYVIDTDKPMYRDDSRTSGDTVRTAYYPTDRAEPTLDRWFRSSTVPHETVRSVVRDVLDEYEHEFWSLLDACVEVHPRYKAASKFH